MDKRKLQVFVSSTYEDLKEERQAAVSAILTAGHIPAGMELFTSGDQSQMDVIREWIDESDVYMLILGGRYGSIEPESGLSYTELEYDYARATNKALFSVVVTESSLNAKVKLSGVSAIEAKEPQKLKAFREKVLSNVSRFFDDVKDIKLAVHETLHDFSRKRSLRGWVPGDAVEDTKPLRDEISRLRQEVSSLTQELESVRLQDDAPNNNSTEEDNFEVVSRILDENKVNIPANISTSGKDIERSFLILLVSNRDLYVRGALIGPSSSERAKWFSRNVYPRYITHKLMKMEERAANTTRYSLTQEGLDLLAWLDRKAYKAKMT